MCFPALCLCACLKGHTHKGMEGGFDYFFPSPLPFFSAFLLFDNHVIPPPHPRPSRGWSNEKFIFLYGVNRITQSKKDVILKPVHLFILTLLCLMSKHIRKSKIGIRCVSFQLHALLSIYRKNKFDDTTRPRGTFLVSVLYLFGLDRFYLEWQANLQGKWVCQWCDKLRAYAAFDLQWSIKDTIERLDQGHPYPLGRRRDKHVTGGARTSAPLQSRRTLYLKSYLDSL